MKKSKEVYKKIAWSLFAVLLAGLSIWAVAAQSKTLSIPKMMSHLRTASPLWLGVAVLCMLGYIFFEGEAVLCILRSTGYTRKHTSGFVYAAADVYFSAITPSATGGQPASAYFMIRDGAPGATTTMALILNLVMYTLTTMTIGVLCLVIRPGMYFQFTFLSRVLIVIGFVIILGLGLFFYMMLRHKSILHSLLDKLLRFLERIKLIRHLKARQRKLKRMMAEYEQVVIQVAGQYPMLIKVYLLNLAQRVSQITVTMAMYLATGGVASRAVDAWITQGYVVIGSSCVPVPGAMGIADYLLYDGLGELVPPDRVADLELLSRGLSFYSCIIISGITIVIGYWIRRKRSLYC